MNNLDYIRLNEVNPEEFIRLLNKQKVREHLIEHQLFDMDMLESWISDKMKVDLISGCKVRAIIFEKQFAGWCGIQLEEEKYEIAIVIDEQFWGIGKAVFQDILSWAKTFDHDELFIHFHHTRPEYKFLRKMAKNVYKSELLGCQFTTYQLALK